ncbi:hypothetical protein Syun_028565 [Stephania yunnanensis]|uniref:Uncharacterized protein n=1 Tax=Stephania yunnanensis TaxID=152371 RepID=A0AAP0E3X4_9MAGN
MVNPNDANKLIYFSLDFKDHCYSTLSNEVKLFLQITMAGGRMCILSITSGAIKYVYLNVFLWI